MKLAEAVTNVKEVEKKAEKEYKALLKTLKSPEYSDLRVLLLRMTVDTILHRRLAEALEKAYKEAIELIEEFGYVDVPETPETAPGNQVSSGLVLIPGIPAVQVAPYGLLGSRIPPEDALEELLKNLPDNVALPPEKLREIRDKLEKLRALCEKMSENYRILEQNAVHPVVQAFAESARKNEEQHKVVVDGLLKRYSEEK
ncbi:hypothetical protein, conserved [Thermococcus kodakarensis KOD1]|uniref:Uncharacterized protein n=1 Tax=Thermococcus kodakarensis (strain ATCC BAA-918 / JCM 12380 / KOD1) TaxID=69014 RepID=Q5JE52_THEKO|nr:hypothetical protein [Thermococcus kodakarensis]WCN29051.1 hypothetical protein POG15_05555 [Thermococcus kodakarensis]WCN31356.1 hypothetical protein POG21_05555 [Thermococcus kodakarensis]BAD85286.1 hypothetical protein, conserved [Thermococcus kodakarensis KOD1]